MNMTPYLCWRFDASLSYGPAGGHGYTEAGALKNDAQGWETDGEGNYQNNRGWSNIA